MTAADITAPRKARFFSWSRVVAVMVKEFIQMRRDRLTFAMIIGVPILQLVLFGYAINTDPKQLPTAVIVADYGPIERSILAAMETSGYFAIDHQADSEAAAQQRLARGDVSYIVTIPAGFQRALVRGERPQLLIEADATDPTAAADALGALNEIVAHGAAQGDHRPAGAARARHAAGRCRHPPPLQPRGHHLLQHRARPARRHPDHDDDPDDRRWRSPARSSAARSRTCSPCRRGPTRSWSARSSPISASASSRWR